MNSKCPKCENTVFKTKKYMRAEVCKFLGLLAALSYSLMKWALLQIKVEIFKVGIVDKQDLTENI